MSKLVLNSLCCLSLSTSDYYRFEFAKALRKNTQEIKKILFEKYKDNGLRLYDYLVKYAPFTVSKAHTVTMLNLELEN